MLEDVIIDARQDFGSESIEELDTLQIIYDTIMDNDQNDSTFYTNKER